MNVRPKFCRADSKKTLNSAWMSN